MPALFSQEHVSSIIDKLKINVRTIPSEHTHQPPRMRSPLQQLTVGTMCIPLSDESPWLGFTWASLTYATFALWYTYFHNLYRCGRKCTVTSSYAPIRAFSTITYLGRALRRGEFGRRSFHGDRSGRQRRASIITFSQPFARLMRSLENALRIHPWEQPCFGSLDAFLRVR